LGHEYVIQNAPSLHKSGLVRPDDLIEF
jgi:hypothetical protein